MLIHITLINLIEHPKHSDMHKNRDSNIGKGGFMCVTAYELKKKFLKG